MAKPGFVDQQQLLQWADSIGSRSELPRLIRRLILETGRGVVQLGFPAGEGVGTAGWDGTVRATQATEHIPEGLSLWELSVEKSVGKKADRDYDKRAATPDGSPTTDCTYIALSLRRFANRAEWARDKSKQGRWKEVRGYGVDDLETWLEAAPVTHAWISEVLGLGAHGLRSAEFWWEIWSSATTPALTPSVVLAGRSEQAKALLDRLSGDPELVTVRAGSIEEVLAFVTAVLMRAAEAGNPQLLARTAFVNDLATWRALAQHRDALILVPRDQAVPEASAAPSHHVLVPVIGAATADIDLLPIDAGEAASALKATGLEPERRADSAGRLARRSLLALRRHLANRPELDQPSWARSPIDREIRGILLAGSWQDGSEADQQVLNALTGTEYEAVRETLARLATEEDPLVASVGRAWSLVSPYDAWLQLQNSLREDDLKRFESEAKRVLLEVNPALELSAEDRWRASIEGKVLAYSADVRHGLAEALALLGVHGGHVAVGESMTAADWAGYVVGQILDEANKDASSHVWASVEYLLPLLAEAAPTVFLEAVRKGLQGKSPVLAKLFTDHDEDAGVFGPSPAHTGLLWALETVAWSGTHFTDAVDRLARLAELDPGGRWANRPSNSLKSIFCPWHPDTSVDVDRRLKVINALRKRHPAVAWNLMLALLPETHSIHDPTHEPQFREWVPPREPVKTVDYARFVRGLVAPLIEDAGDSVSRWTALIEQTTALPPDDRRTLREALATRLKKGGIAEADLHDLWASLRAFIANHHEFAHTNWALPEEELAELEGIERSIAPDEPSARVAWLFAEHFPDLGDEHQRKEDYAGYKMVLEERRRDAVAEVEAAEGFEGIKQLGRQSLGGFVGAALAGATPAKYDEEMLALLATDTASDTQLAWGYLVQRFEQEGRQWVEELLRKDPPLSPTQKARVLLATYDFPKAWEVADTEGSDVAEAYWKLFSPLGLGQDFAYVADVVRGLLRVGREAAALDTLSLYSRDKGSDPQELATLIAEGLDALLKKGTDDSEIRALSQYDFQTLFSYLEEHKDAVGWERVARLEWAYLGALGYDANVPELNRLLATDPDIFLQVITAIYRPHSEPKDERPKPSPEEERVGTNAYRLLSSWKTVPGLKEDGKLDPDRLRAWVEEAIRKLEDVDRKEVGEIYIGHVLAYAPAGEDGVRPAPEVRDLLEDLQADGVEQGLRTELYNQRGVTSRDPEEGGNQERVLAKQYAEQADAVADQWPRTAAVLRDLAESYEHDARRYEREAERRRRGLDP